MRSLAFALSVVTLGIGLSAFPGYRTQAQGNQPGVAVLVNGAPVSSVTASTPFTIAGSNFRRNETYFVGVLNYAGVAAVQPDANGNFAVPWPAFGFAAGTVYPYAGEFRGGRFEIVAQTTLTVTP